MGLLSSGSKNGLAHYGAKLQAQWAPHLTSHNGLFELCTQSGLCDVNSISVNAGFSLPKPLRIQSRVIVITQGNVAVQTDAKKKRKDK